jgi:putative ubiquitin-RnfH superfamily antitoxin RatB of RatAB toxin-antitoxin module
MITVKVARLGNAVQEVALSSGATVQNALDAADLMVENEEIRVNSSTAGVNDEVRNGDIVTLVPKVKGGQKIVKVARLGSTVQEVAVEDDATVEMALDAADVMVENEEVRLDGRSAGLSERIGSASMITIVPKVKGGK